MESNYTFEDNHYCKDCLCLEECRMGCGPDVCVCDPRYDVDRDTEQYYNGQ